METLQRSSEIARSSSARLDDAFVSRQRYRLEKARDVLLRELGHALSEEARPNRAARGSSHAREALVWLEKRLRRRLRAVERALQKIEEGTYGTCDVTGEAIPPQRLEAIPEAFCTLEAQRQRRVAF